MSWPGDKRTNIRDMQWKAGPRKLSKADAALVRYHAELYDALRKDARERGAERDHILGRHRKP